MKYKNPHLSKNMLPTLDQLKKYVQQATNIDIKYRDVRPLMSFLQRLPQVDRYLLGLMQTRKIAVLGFPFDIVHPDDITVTEQEKKKLEAIKTRFVKGKIQKLFNTIMNGILFGLSASELTWANDKQYGTMVIGKRNLELTELDFNLDDNDKLNLLVTGNNSILQSQDELDQNSHLYVRYNPLEGIENDFPGSFMRSNMLYVWLKYTDYFNWASANEKFGDPLVVAQYDKVRTSPEDMATINAGLESLGTAAKASFSKDVELKFIEALRSGITDMHEKFIDQINKEMSISILGQTLTTDITKVGSFAAAKVHNFVRQDILWGDIIEFQNILTTQYVHKDYFLNYGEPPNGYPHFEFITDEIQDFESNARTLYELKIAYPTMQFKKKEVYDRTGWSEPVEGDELIPRIEQHG